MSFIFQITNILLLLLCGSLFAYLALLSFLSLTHRQKIAVHKVPPCRRFAVVIPAHNEELTIEKTLQSLKQFNYPKDKYHLIVVADNCTDQTSEKARTNGARVFERTEPSLAGKGRALRWCFDILLSERPSYDAVVVIDADSTASENFLRVMNAYLEQGLLVMQSSDLVVPQPQAWSSEVTRLGFTLYNYVRPLGRQALGCSVGLRGNGMCFSTEVFQKVRWNAYSLAEDLEYGLNLLLHRISVRLAPEATVWATMPLQATHAETQRTRWEVGRLPLITKYAPRLATECLRQRSLKPLDALVDLITPPFVNLMGFSTVLLLTNAILWFFGAKEAKEFLLWWILLIGIGAIHVFVGLLTAGSDRYLYRALANVPRYALWKLSLYAKLTFFGREKGWIRTTREGDSEQLAGGEDGKNTNH